MQHPEEEMSQSHQAAPVTTPDVGRRRRWRGAKPILLILLLLWLIGLAIPGQPGIPVEGATHLDWDPGSYWHQESAGSAVHKGIDISATQGTPVISATPGLVLFTARLDQGSSAVMVLGPRWRVHTYANLKQADLAGGFIARAAVLGSVGAGGKDSQLHYSIFSLVPLPWRFDRGPEGWKKMFYLDPSEELESS